MSESISPTDYEAMMEEGKFPDGMSEFAELMIHDEKIPALVRKLWWGFINKDTILTRSNMKNDLWEASNDFAIRRNLHLMSQPSYKNNIEEVVNLDNIRRRFTTQHRRSHDGFERQALMTQIRELRHQTPSSDTSGGVWSGIKKKLGFGPKEKEGG